MNEIRHVGKSQTVEIIHQHSAASASEVLQSNRKLRCARASLSTLLLVPKSDMKQTLLGSRAGLARPRLAHENHQGRTNLTYLHPGHLVK